MQCILCLLGLSLEKFILMYLLVERYQTLAECLVVGDLDDLLVGPVDLSGDWVRRSYL